MTASDDPTLSFLPAVSECTGGPPTPPISVTVLPPGTTSLPAGASVNVTAQVTNDSSNRGVMWSVSCPTPPCGSVVPPTTGSGDAALFTAPSIAPTSPVGVTVTATSIADNTKSGSVALNLLTAIAVNLSATVNQVGAGGTSQISATVSNDPANRGVNHSSWSISPSTGAGDTEQCDVQFGDIYCAGNAAAKRRADNDHGGVSERLDIHRHDRDHLRGDRGVADSESGFDRGDRNIHDHSERQFRSGQWRRESHLMGPVWGLRDAEWRDRQFGGLHGAVDAASEQ